MEPKESMMSHDYSPKSLKLKISQGSTRSHIDIYTRHHSGASTLSFLRGRFQSGRKKRNQNQKHDSSFSELPLVRHLLDQLHATSPMTNSASTARTAGQQLPCAKIQDPVWVDRSHSLGRAPAGGKKHRNLTLLERLPPSFIFWQKTVEVLRDRQSWATTKSRKSRGPKGASELRGLPAHLPRNLASFSPSVDDRDGGGSRPCQLVHHRHFLLHSRGGATVLMEPFNGHRRTWRQNW